ncbi:3-keto-5-aminohexanoate cleavage protein [Papillibacter cinnamivorans]|uniref:Uncharacterized conserved protein, DUF849 family n=1 Tax=Papillibacter cinnamivorans DSM 12816 TaxID=1122930 RepID=A0A1W2CAE1_9FIRM|nr:3-keto-5-aminohexanoate cleavage protein [Papillibacter cinnamivorans]SMC81842.1 Uncharacterized conserved protein, DUF849 family [Papillibacter cinnamivorans DSM 12816]
MSTGLENKVIITAALTGAVTPKSISPNTPITPEEIAEDAYKCWKAGAAIVHLHMRTDDGIGTMDKERFKKTVSLIRAKTDCDIVVNCTTSGDNNATDETRMAHIKEIPAIELASYDAGTFNWMPSFVFYNTPQFLTKLGTTMQEYDVKPEVEIFDMGMLNNAKYYLGNGVLKSPMYCQLVMGVGGAMEATVENLLYLVNHLPKDTVWSAFGIGTAHLPIMYAALALGGHIRVGLEDNVYFSKGVKASNPQLVDRAVQAITTFGKEPATPAEARQILGLKPLVR